MANSNFISGIVGKYDATTGKAINANNVNQSVRYVINMANTMVTVPISYLTAGRVQTGGKGEMGMAVWVKRV